MVERTDTDALVEELRAAFEAVRAGAQTTGSSPFMAAESRFLTAVAALAGRTEEAEQELAWYRRTRWVERLKAERDRAEAAEQRLAALEQERDEALRRVTEREEQMVAALTLRSDRAARAEIRVAVLETEKAAVRELAKRAKTIAAAPDYDEEVIWPALWAVVDSALAAGSDSPRDEEAT